MIVAEFCDLIRKTKIKDERGSLPHNLGSYYNEFQIINYLGEDIFALDHRNQVVRIEPQKRDSKFNDVVHMSKEEDRCIIIQYRFVQGPRTIGSMAMETTQATHCKMVIPRSVLLREPVFVEELNAVLFNPNWHPTTNLHPHSMEYVAKRHAQILKSVGNEAIYSPITIMANDPTGRFKALHIEINGKICSVKVTNCNTDEHERDIIVMCIRSLDNEAVEHREIIETTFGDLLRQNPLCWNLGGFTVSSDRVWLENKLAVEKIKPTPNVVPVEEVKSLIERARTEDRSVIENMTEILKQKDQDIKEWKARFSSLKESYDDIVRGDYLSRNSNVAFKKMDIEENKITASVQEAKIQKTVEWIKLTKEHIATIGTIAKTIAVMVPLAILYIKYKQQKAA